MRRGRRGSSYVEVLGATALFGVALLGSAGLLLQWHETSERLEQRALAEHALAHEMDALLLNQAPLPVGTRDWFSEADAESGLESAVGELRVTSFEGGKLRRVVIALRWSGGEALRETVR